ncbi:MAG: 6-phosphogluconolactonase [Pseudomonadota bacterium]
MKDYNVNFRGFNTSIQLALELAETVAFSLRSGVEKNSFASLVVSGGSTPVPFFTALAVHDIRWDKVYITLADERWVSTGDDDSNELLVRTYLLKGRAAAARFVGLMTGTASPALGEAACGKRIAAIPRPFDAVVLGMGNDGHTASLLSGAKDLPAATDMGSGKFCCAISSVNAKHERLTLTLSTLIDARSIFLHITGRDKLKVFEKAVGQGEMSEMPIRHVLAHSAKPVNVYWAP